MKIQGIMPKSWNGRNFVELNIEGRTVSCWQRESLNLKIGDEVEGEITERGNGKTPNLKLTSVNGTPVQSAQKGSYGGGKGNVQAFACAYAKDLCVALINKEIVATNQAVRSSFVEFYEMFIEKMQ